ncbi:uncharacterized protein LOC106170617 [Lingula anatina]|uniref:Uncharacterized protein LOC106170617 n=1 Tax=Lingula anatina TaxID=7574 RepID=A0A1S3J6L3_LINAN|nr:uncharacterized protein LOC106170617 [Lingula anatina]|eukprot:XP_013406030.1 uncharacterized protein LOC106170617 [Lingula anatina]
MASVARKHVCRLLSFYRSAVSLKSAFNVAPIGARTFFSHEALKLDLFKEKQKRIRSKYDKETFLHKLTEVDYSYHGNDIETAIYLADKDDCEILMDVLNIFNSKPGSTSKSAKLTSLLVQNMHINNMASHIAKLLSNVDLTRSSYSGVILPALDCLFDNKMYDELLDIVFKIVEGKGFRAENAGERDASMLLMVLSLFSKGDEESYDLLKEFMEEKHLYRVKTRCRIQAVTGRFALKMGDMEYAEQVLFEYTEHWTKPDKLLINTQVAFYLASKDWEHAIKMANDLLNNSNIPQRALFASDVMAELTKVIPEGDEYKSMHEKLLKEVTLKNLTRQETLDEMLRTEKAVLYNLKTPEKEKPQKYSNKTDKTLVLRVKPWKLFLEVGDIYN